MKRNGFSLIELLVAIVIAGIVLSAVMGSYFSLLQASQRADAARQLQKELNFAVIRMADKIRSFSIHYQAYDDSSTNPGSSETLFTRGVGSDEIHKFERTAFQWQGKDFYTLSMDGAPLFSKIFNVEAVFFKISPLLDPSAPENLGKKEAQLQPKATIFLKAVSLQYPEINISIQTTISSRKYE
ncbi:type II secretion system GspH family protein [Candidatus Gracilibacteria bacterium]|nr:type II secretion system GspH family protein [Candidatus Gracilibacteria bacterium]